jgi:putative PEP-CTERM system TPR-repeat lipoprotein
MNGQRKTYRVTAAILISLALTTVPAQPSIADLILSPNTPPANVAQGGTTPTDESKGDVSLAQRYIAEKQFDQAIEVGKRIVAANPDQPMGFDVQGVALLGKKDFVRARASFEAAVRLNPDDRPALISLAQLDLQESDATSARKRYDRLLDKEPTFIPALIGMANVEAAQGKSQAILPWLDKAVKADPNALAPRLALATYYLKSKENGKALVALKGVGDSHGNSPEFLSVLGEVQGANGQSSESIATYKRLVVLRPDMPEAHYRLGAALTSERKDSEAAQSLEKALQLKSDYVEAAVLLARLEYRNGHGDKALKLARDLQKTAPRSAAGLALEGDLQMEKDAFADAAKTYRRAFGVEQTSLLAIKLHGAQSRAGNAKQADAGLQQWLNDHPDDVLALEYFGNEDLKAGRNQAAIAKFERVISRSPSSFFALNNLALLYQRLNDPRALATAERAYELMPNSTAIADTLGWILVQQGNTGRGLMLIQKAAAARPTSTEIRYHLAFALAKSGDKAKSREELKGLLADKKPFPQRQAAEALLKEL